MVHLPTAKLYDKQKHSQDFHNGKFAMDNKTGKIEKPKWIELLETEADNDKWKFWDQRFLKVS